MCSKSSRLLTRPLVEQIANEGSAAIAEALKANPTLNEINLLGQPHAFGENWCALTRFATFSLHILF